MHVVRPHPGALVVALLAAACWHRTPAPPAFEVLRTSPILGSDTEPILLNDSITIYFSDTIQALSVTPDSVSLVDEEDRPVRGSLRVGSNWATFQPEPPLTRELTDGSLRPGGAYRLFVAGYPRHDAVRASDGRRLAAAVAFPVRVAGIDYRPVGLPAPLRPPMSELPFVLRPQDPPVERCPRMRRGSGFVYSSGVADDRHGRRIRSALDAQPDRDADAAQRARRGVAAPTTSPVPRSRSTSAV
jgi:hypothetical protein